MLEQMSHQQQTQDPERSYLIKNTVVTSACQGLATISAFVLDAMIVSTFGLGHETDAYFAALALPLTVTSIIQSQGPAVLVPVFTAAIEKNGRHVPSALLSSLLNASALILCAIALLGVIASPVLVPLLVPGLSPTAQPLA